jgi:hypothetical protein
VRRRLLLTLLCAPAFLGCGGARRGESGACADAFRWHGRVYFAVLVQRPLPAARAAVRVHYPGCRDTNGASDTGSDVTLHTLAGIPASIALRDRAAKLYVADDSLPALRAHPLHRYLYVPSPGARRPRGCRREALSGRMGGVPFGDRFLVHVRRRAVALRLEPGTRLRSRVVDGVPRIREGDRVTVSALACPGRVVKVARRLSVG